MNTRPIILITNDDGINAPGIRTLIEIVKPLGDVMIVAPEQSYSGMGHAVTLTTPIRLRNITKSKEYSEYACSGTPVDCVKLALNNLMPQRPDLIVSGINHGANSSVNIIYSGTMAAAIEGALGGVTSVGFSLLDFSYDADFDAGKVYIGKIISDILSSGFEKGSCFNVNIPAVRPEEIKGIKVCRQAKGNWVEAFDERTDPHNSKYYWLSGTFNHQEKCLDTDLWALENNYISIVPVTLDFTKHEQIAAIKNLECHD